MHAVEHIIHECDRAIVAEEFDTLMSHYIDDAILVVRPGSNVIGAQEIRAAFQEIARHFQHGLEVTQLGMEILEAGNSALVLAKTLIEAPNQSPEERAATYVFINVNERWLCSIDNSYGHQILDANQR